MITVNFLEVGRDKRSWSKSFKGPLKMNSLAREAKSGAGLMSSGVDAELDDSGLSGVILVGGFREVGKFTISKPNFN